MAEFQITHQDLGRLPENIKKTIIFPYVGDLNLIGENPITSSCGCSVPTLNRELKCISIEYNTPTLGIHPHTKQKIFEQDTTKEIIVTEIDRQTKLTFRNVTVS